MNPYSHIVVASKLETYVKPEDPKEYYWGAIAPDARYLAAMRREQTHLPSQQIVEFIFQYPQLKSFLQGYLVHCLSDEIDLRQIFFHHFPFSILKSKMLHKQTAVLLELFYFETEKIKISISSAHNEVLTKLGLSESISARFSQSINRYTECSSHESRVSELFELLGLVNDTRVERYIKAARVFQRYWFLRNVLFLGIRTGKISEEVVSNVTSLLASVQIPAKDNP